MTYALALAFGMAALHRLRVVGLASGLAGAMMVLLPRASLPDPGMLPWVLLSCVTLAFACAAPLFLYLRERRLAELQHESRPNLAAP